MKKLLLALGLCVSFAAKTYALYFGNISEAEIIDQGIVLSKDNWMALKLGYQGDFVFDRKLQVHPGKEGRIDEFKTQFQQGVIALDFADRAEFFGSAGIATAYMSNRPNSDNRRREYQTAEDFTWGVGARGVLVNWGNTALGVDASIQYADFKTKWEAIDGVSYNQGTIINYREWQAGIAASHKIEILIPYFAVKYSNVRGKVKDVAPQLMIPGNKFKLKNRTYVGVALGATISMGTIFDLTVETQLIDEEAVSLAMNIKF